MTRNSFSTVRGLLIDALCLGGQVLFCAGLFQIYAPLVPLWCGALATAGGVLMALRKRPRS